MVVRIADDDLAIEINDKAEGVDKLPIVLATSTKLAVVLENQAHALVIRGVEDVAGDQTNRDSDHHENRQDGCSVAVLSMHHVFSHLCTIHGTGIPVPVLFTCSSARASASVFKTR